MVMFSMCALGFVWAGIADEGESRQFGWSEVVGFAGLPAEVP